MQLHHGRGWTGIPPTIVLGPPMMPPPPGGGGTGRTSNEFGTLPYQTSTREELSSTLLPVRRPTFPGLHLQHLVMEYGLKIHSKFLGWLRNSTPGCTPTRDPSTQELTIGVDMALLESTGRPALGQMLAKAPLAARFVISSFQGHFQNNPVFLCKRSVQEQACRAEVSQMSNHSCLDLFGPVPSPC